MKVIIGFQKNFDENIEWYWKKAAALIKWGTKSDYFHVELVVDGKWIGSHTTKGIEIHDYDPAHFNSYFDYFELEVDDITESQRKKFWDWVNKEAGSGYDWKGIYLTQMFNMDWESKDKWFCSEIVVKMLQMLYVTEFIDEKPNRASPQTILNLIKHKLVQLHPETPGHI